MRAIFTFITIMLIFLSHSESNAQYTNNIWCFGDSAGINFNTNPPTPITLGMRSRDGSCSISDINGNLLLYANTFEYNLWNGSQIKNSVVRNKIK